MNNSWLATSVLKLAVLLTSVAGWTSARAQQPSVGSEGPMATNNDPEDATTQRQPFARSLDDEEIAEALQFAEANMPNFYNLWRRLPPDRQRRMPPRMQWGFRLMFEAKKAQDDRLFEVLSRQMVLRDEFIALRREYRRSGQSEDVRQELMAKVEELVQAGIQQRELRIEKLEGMLAAEKLKLERDRQDPKRLVDDQYRRLEDETTQFVAFVRRFQPLGTGVFPGFPRPTTGPAVQPSAESGSQ